LRALARGSATHGSPQLIARLARRYGVESRARRPSCGIRPAVGLVQRALPVAASTAIAKAAQLALERALDVALFSLKDRRLAGGRKFHSGLACTSGAIGGAFGLPALAVELPVTTMIMLRAIATIAREEGEDLADPCTGLACLEVFALGASTVDREAPESDYFAVRAVLARGVVEVADFVIDKSAVRESAPVVVRFLAQLASRFGIVVTEKVMAQAVAVVGAVGGAAINLAFIEHFQDVARGHFTIRRLERIYGADAVRVEYDRIKSEQAQAHGGPAEPGAAIADQPRLLVC
jgi:hypothetical protein